ncbi:hypothetical protein, partial [Novipirellula maiorica]|uniref:hypothetical protein n=1 Tax=Novipirellula maiorica TaxID=1265734 RepID=UPI001F44C70D
MSFSRTLLASGAPAWQRYQAVRAVECYRDLVLARSEPDLSDVVRTLAKLQLPRRFAGSGTVWRVGYRFLPDVAG